MHLHDITFQKSVNQFKDPATKLGTIQSLQAWKETTYTVIAP